MVAIDFPDSPVDGQVFDIWIWDDTGSKWAWNAEAKFTPIEIEYLVIAGGGGGSGRARNIAMGGAGAGGYRSSVFGESSGGGASAESPLILFNSFTVTVGAGGSGGLNNEGTQGADSVFHTVTSSGGAFGEDSVADGQPGGSGSGAQAGNTPDYVGGLGTSGQGFDGGDSFSSTTGTLRAGGGGGGAGAVGEDGTSGVAGNGGDGVASSITGSSITRAGGGGGTLGSSINDGSSSGGSGGGGNGVWSSGLSATGGNGSANTGGGAGSARGGDASAVVQGGNGGSGVVILKYPDTYALTAGAGLTSSTSTSGGYNITTFTAGSDTVTIGVA